MEDVLRLERNSILMCSMFLEIWNIQFISVSRETKDADFRIQSSRQPVRPRDLDDLDRKSIFMF